MTSSRTVGSRARTVYVQSSWFCSKRRRKLDHGQHLTGRNHLLLRNGILLFRYPVLTHALSRLGDLAQDILASDVADTDDAGANGEVRAIASEPTTRSSNHRSIEGRSGVVFVMEIGSNQWYMQEWFRCKPPSSTRDDELPCLGLLACSRLVGLSSLICQTLHRLTLCQRLLLTRRRAVLRKDMRTWRICHPGCHTYNICGTTPWAGSPRQAFCKVQETTNVYELTSRLILIRACSTRFHKHLSQNLHGNSVGCYSCAGQHTYPQSLPCFPCATTEATFFSLCSA